MKKWKKKAIKEIMDNFDFKKVHKTMVALEWKWFIENKEPKLSSAIPDIKDIKDTALNCLNTH
jgi:hypothetical protein